jgi:tRNA dimethylallyltransferase
MFYSTVKTYCLTFLAYGFFIDLTKGFTGEEKPLQSIGYKETLAFIKKEIPTLAELEEQISIHTRQLAKSQRTWFNRDSFKKEFHPLTQREDLFKQVDEFIKK